MFVGTVVAGAEGDTWLGYVQATAEASMVGGLADWFAVVALFRHPLGVPIPHTAIITERKEQFGETLGEFIQSSFLTGDAVAERVRAANVGDRVARWLADPANADRLAGHVLGGAVEVVDLLEDEAVHDVLERLVRERLEAASIVPMAGRALGALTKEGRHDEVVDAALQGLDRYLDEHRDELHDAVPRPGAVVAARRRRGPHLRAAPRRRPGGARRHGQRPRPRPAPASSTPRSCRSSTSCRPRPSCARQGRAAHPRPARAARAARLDRVGVDRRQGAAARASPPIPSRRCRQQLAAAITSGGERLLAEPALVAKIDDAAEAAARYVVEHFGGEINQLVSTTIARWDGEETSERLELLLGPDLQFIRINGTVVGGVAGLALHSIAQVLGYAIPASGREGGGRRRTLRHGERGGGSARAVLVGVVAVGALGDDVAGRGRRRIDEVLPVGPARRTHPSCRCSTKPPSVAQGVVTPAAAPCPAGEDDRRADHRLARRGTGFGGTVTRSPRRARVHRPPLRRLRRRRRPATPSGWPASRR